MKMNVEQTQAFIFKESESYHSPMLSLRTEEWVVRKLHT